MPHNCYSQLDALLQTHQNVQDYVLAHAAELADAPAHKTIYSTPSLLLGLYTPTLLLGIHYSGAYKKGQKLKSSGNRTDYLSYDYDSDGNLLRIMDHGDGLKFFTASSVMTVWSGPSPFSAIPRTADTAITPITASSRNGTNRAGW